MQQIKDLRAEGNKLFNAKRYDDAITKYTQALSETEQLEIERSCNEDKSMLLSNRSMAYYRLGNYEQSLKDARDVLEYESTSPKALYRAGLACMMLEKPDEACGYLQALVTASAGPSTAMEGDAQTETELLLLHAQSLKKHVHLVDMYKKDRMGDVDVRSASNEDHTAVACVKLALHDLTDDVEGDADADVASCLAILHTHLAQSAHARAVFEATCGYRLLWYYFASETFGTAVAGVLRSAATPRVFWPTATWQRLLHFAQGKEGAVLAGIAAELIQWAAESNPIWIQRHVLVDLVPETNTPFLTSLVNTASRHPSSSNTATTIGCKSLVAISNLLALYGGDAGSVAALHALACRPVQALLEGFEIAAEVLSSEREISHKFHLEMAKGRKEVQADTPYLSPSEEEARDELLAKQRAVYDSELVSIQRALLTTLCVLTSWKELVLDESLVAVRKTPTQRSCSSPTASSSVSSLSKQKQGKVMMTSGPLVPQLLRLLHVLVDRAPKRTTPVLGPDGTPAAYTKRQFAADFVDNPAGDFLANLDLCNKDDGRRRSPRPKAKDRTHKEEETTACFLPGECDGDGAPRTALHAGALTSPTDPVGRSQTLLQLALDAALNVFKCGSSIGIIGYRNNILPLCEMMCRFLTPEVVIAGQRLSAAVCHASPAARDEILCGGEQGTSSSITILCGIVHYSSDASIVATSLDILASQVDACSGDDFAALTRADVGVVVKCADLACATADTEGHHEATQGLREPAKRLMKLCAERALRIQGTAGRGGTAGKGPRAGALPSGGGWACVGAPVLRSILYGQPSPSACKEKGMSSNPSNIEAEGQGLGALKKGFFLGGTRNLWNSCTHTNDAGTTRTNNSDTIGSQQQSASQGSSKAVYSNGVVIEDVTEEKGAIISGREGKCASRSLSVNKSQGIEGEAEGVDRGVESIANEEESIPDLYDVFDSTPTDPRIRSSRSAWLALPAESRMPRWSQTSTDLSAWFKIPLGTAVQDISVILTPAKLSIGLKWFGKVAEGTLYSRIKSREATWCLEDDEIHVVLPKDGIGQWWKALMKGGEEKGYYQLLQDAVEADEPAVPYDDMDPASKDLLDSILERQAYVNAGLIDLENGFDDFRIVLGESSLGLTQEQTSAGDSGATTHNI